MPAQTFFPTVATLLTRAMTDIGVVDPEGGLTPTTAQTTDALQVLNFLVTSWAADGLQVWCQRDTSGLALTAAQSSYTIGNSAATPNWSLGATGWEPKEITQMWLRDTTVTPNIDIPLQPISREDYFRLSQKSASGTPVSFFYDPRYDAPGSNTGTNAMGKVYLWPTPAAADATRYTVGMVYTRPISDISATTDALDFPPEWYNAVRWGLAEELAIQYEVPVTKLDRIKVKAAETKRLALSFDRERQSLTLSPDNA